MIFCPPNTICINAINEIRQRGISKESNVIDEKIDEINNHITSPLSLSWKQRLLWNTDETFTECSIADWDGYDATPISENSLFSTKQLIASLPLGIDEPAVVPEPSGELALLWQEGKEKILSLSAIGSQLVYAGLFGGDIKYGGVSRFSDEFDPKIKALLQEYFSKK